MKLKNKVMKKVIVIMAIAISLFACKKDNDVPNNGNLNGNGTPIIELDLSAYYGVWKFTPYTPTAGCSLSSNYEIRQADNHDELWIGITLVKVTPKPAESQDTYLYNFADKSNKYRGKFYSGYGDMLIDKCYGILNKK